jgi:hypothetical protein
MIRRGIFRIGVRSVSACVTYRNVGFREPTEKLQPVSLVREPP